jgi:hypothetical protein
VGATYFFFWWDCLFCLEVDVDVVGRYMVGWDNRDGGCRDAGKADRLDHSSSQKWIDSICFLDTYGWYRQPSLITLGLKLES